MRKIYSFCNQKGGVGKTTSVVNIATILAEHGLKTLLIDLDPQGNATSGLGEEKPKLEFTTYQLLVDNSDAKSVIRKTSIENLDIIPSCADLAGAELELVSKTAREFILRMQLRKLEKDYDFIFMDCPPSLGLLTVNALNASDYIIIPLQCEYYAMEGLGQLINTFQIIKDRLNQGLEIGGVLMTMADFRTNLTQQVIEEVKNHFKDNVFNTVIPRSVKLSEAPSFGKPAVIYDPHNRGSIAYRNVALEFIEKFTDKEVDSLKKEFEQIAQSPVAQGPQPEAPEQPAEEKQETPDNTASQTEEMKS